MKSKWIVHKGKEIIYCDYSNLDFDSLEREVDSVDSQVEARPYRSVLGLVNVDGIVSAPRSLEILKRSTVRVKSYVRKTAVIGLGRSVAQLTLFNLVSQVGRLNSKAFETFEEACDWLAAD